MIILTEFRIWARNVYERHPQRFHLCNGSAHAIYFFLAFIEGSGMYAYASGALALATVTALAVSP